MDDRPNFAVAAAAQGPERPAAPGQAVGGAAAAHALVRMP